jgi:uncharacterized MAPEG superfamily protein
MRPLTVTGQRPRGARQMHEALPVFLGLALEHDRGAGRAQAKTGALVFLVARVLYTGVYIAGVSVVHAAVGGGLGRPRIDVAALLDRI